MWNLSLWAPLLLLLLVVMAAYVLRATRLEATSGATPARESQPHAVALKYGFALLAIVVAATVRWWLVLNFGPVPPYLTFYPAVLLVVLVAGGGPGALAILGSMLAASYSVIPPVGFLIRLSPPDLIGRVIFVLSTATLCILSERLRQAHWAEYQRFRLLLDGMKDVAIFMMDPEGRVTSWNGGAQRLTGLSAAETIGRHCAFFYPAEDIALGKPVQELAIARDRGQTDGEGWMVRKDASRFWASSYITALRNPKGAVVGFGRICWDLTNRREIESQLSAREIELGAANRKLREALEQQRRTTETLESGRRLLQLFVDNAPAEIAMFDREMRYVACSRRWVTDFGLDGRDLVGRCHYEVFPEIPERWKAVHRAALQGVVQQSDEDLFERADGTSDCLRWEVHPWRNETDEIAGVIVFSENITAQRRRDEALRALNLELERQVDVRTAELREREVLLQEVHHRVKNNLQVICSLLNLQMRRLPDASSRKVLEQSYSRVQAMAQIHEILYQSKDHAHVPFWIYARDLVTRICGSSSPPSASIALTFDLDEIPLPVEQAIPCGLILNELVVNALKHAFPAAARGTIHVGLRRAPGREILLSVCDDGVGIPDAFDLARSDSLGVQLVHGLVAQLQGRIEVIRQPGATFRISFPLAAVEAAA